jgi:hypothetical protein
MTVLRKSPTLELSAEERAKLSDEALFAYYKRTHHLQDIEFFLAHHNPGVMTGALRRDWLSLRARAPKMAKAAAVREYRILQGRYWSALLQWERAQAALTSAA